MIRPVLQEIICLWVRTKEAPTTRYEVWDPEKNRVALRQVSFENLQHFFAKLEDGTDYEPESLCTMLATLDRHYRAYIILR